MSYDYTVLAGTQGAMNHRMIDRMFETAAKLRVPIASLEVEVQADYDNGALFGVGRNSPGYQDVRYTVTIESSAPPQDVSRVVDEGDAHNPYLHIFAYPQTCRRTVRVLPPRVPEEAVIANDRKGR